jgi:hypothetical protein
MYTPTLPFKGTNKYTLIYPLPLKRHKNVGGLFVIDIVKGKVAREHKHYKTALKHYHRLGGNGHALIVPKADSLNFIASTLVEDFSTTRL